MGDAMFVLSNARVPRSGRISVLSTNKYQKRLDVNPSIPSYMQKRDNAPLVFSFTELGTASVFLDHQLHLQPIVSAKIDPRDETLRITYVLSERPAPMVDTELQDLFDYDQEEISRFVLQTHSSFYLIDDVTVDEDSKEARAQGIVLNPLDDVEMDQSYQGEINRVLESIYRLK